MSKLKQLQLAIQCAERKRPGDIQFLIMSAMKEIDRQYNYSYIKSRHIDFQYDDFVNYKRYNEIDCHVIGSAIRNKIILSTYKLDPSMQDHVEAISTRVVEILADEIQGLRTALSKDHEYKQILDLYFEKKKSVKEAIFNHAI